ncbi:MAG: hypothetical protein K4571_00560 [Deltaproteobacteria bacterium]
MIKYIWRQILFSFLLVSGCFVSFYQILMIISDPIKNLKYLPLFLSFLLMSTASFIILKKLGMSSAAFIEILKNNNFIIEYKIMKRFGYKIPAFLGLRSDGILIYAIFSYRYWPDIRNLFNFAGTGIKNLHFYFPCHVTSEINHNVIKYDSKIEIGHGLYPLSHRSKIKAADAELKKILSEMCADIDLLIINSLQAGRGFILIETGPSSLAYGKYIKKNIPAVLKFIQAFRAYYGCQDEKWDRQIDMSNLKQSIDTLNKEFIHSLRENYKNK